MILIESIKTTVLGDENGEFIGTLETLVYRQSWPWTWLHGEWTRARLWTWTATDGWMGGSGNVLFRAASLEDARAHHEAAVSNYRFEAHDFGIRTRITSPDVPAGGNIAIPPAPRT